MYRLYPYIFLSLVWILCQSSHNPEIGDIIDTYNGVPVYYNGRSFRATHGRNTTPDGYNLGLKYQCVEYIKRYYYEYYGHKMPYAGGNARDFFDHTLGDRGYNKKRDLMQYHNVRIYKPQAGDILVYNNSSGNPFGHIAVVTEVGQEHVEIIQQNMGKRTRERLKLVNYRGYYTVADFDVLGWLRKEK